VRIAIIGNVASGKTTLARQISNTENIEVTHIDSIQYLTDLSLRPYTETIEILNKIHQKPSWIIDGYGPLDILEKRFEICDQIIFLDPPVWKNYFRLILRQIKNIFYPRQELPKNSKEWSLRHTAKLFRTINQQHQKMRPELIRILNREQNKKKLLIIVS
jgi:adenylate kinase family enzyme